MLEIFFIDNRTGKEVSKETRGRLEKIVQEALVDYNKKYPDEVLVDVQVVVQDAETR